MLRGMIEIVITWEIDCAIVVSIHLIDHVLQFRLAGILSKGAHNSSELLGGDLSYSSS
jgi:hypothetical protein